jgi:hypothetical protein
VPKQELQGSCDPKILVKYLAVADLSRNAIDESQSHISAMLGDAEINRRLDSNHPGGNQ